MKCDVVVVGMGAAGTAAAGSAAETARARGTPFDIVIVEKAPEEHWGGNSRWTDANMRLQEPEHLAPGFEADLSAFSRGKSDPHIRPFVENIPETIRWVRAQCVEFERRPLDVWPYPPYTTSEAVAEAIRDVPSPEAKQHAPADFFDNSFLDEIVKSGFPGGFIKK